MTVARSTTHAGFIGKHVTVYTHGGTRFEGLITDVLHDTTDGCDWLIFSNGWTVQYEAIAAAKWRRTTPPPQVDSALIGYIEEEAK